MKKRRVKMRGKNNNREKGKTYKSYHKARILNRYVG